MSNSTSNVPVSLPLANIGKAEVEMNGFGWTADGGLFIPIDSIEPDLDPPKPIIQIGNKL